VAQLTKHKRFQRSFKLSEGDVQLPKQIGQTVQQHSAVLPSISLSKQVTQTL